MLFISIKLLIENKLTICALENSHYHILREKFETELIIYIMQERRSAFKILTGKPTGKRPLGRPRRRWEDNIRMDLEEIGTNAGNWVNSVQDRDLLGELL